ncbi:MAG: hypothetical protein IJ745_03990 [Bacteroidales bacterium]|nr:hypothetical protein [Bacteroidales bacterium]
MKRIFRFFALAAVGTALMGMVSCGKDEEKTSEEDIVITESATYAVYFNNNVIAAGDTVVCQPTLSDMRNGLARFDFLFFNKTETPVSSMVKLEMADGPSSMNHVLVCGGANNQCMEQDCPWTSEAYPIEPGLDTQHPLSVEFTPGTGEQAVYRLRVMEQGKTDNAQIIYFNVIL